MKIGILGSGEVAISLAAGFLARGHEVMLGTRHASKLEKWKNERGERAHTGSFAQCVAFGEIVVLATLGSATLDVIAHVGAHEFAAKTVIDATNPLRTGDGGPELYVGWNDSLGEQVQAAIPHAKVVKAFNTVGHAHMVDPAFPGGPPDMFICGNDETAKHAVTGILHDFGWGTIDLGGIERSRYLEPMCLVWVLYGMRGNGWNHAFKMLRA